MIPQIPNNRTASWGKHVHSLFGLKVSDFTQDGSGVSLDDGPFILDDYEPDGEAGEGWPLELGAPPSSSPYSTATTTTTTTTTTTLSPLFKWDNGPFVREQTPTRYAGILDHETGREGDFMLPRFPEGVKRNSLASNSATTLPDLTRTIGLLGGGGHGDAPSDAAGPMFLDVHNNVTDWMNDTSWSWDTDGPSVTVNETLACTNFTLNESRCALEGAGPLVVTPESLSLCLILLFFAVSTIFGNGLVVVAVARERYLHTVTNYFIMSLAVADGLVGALVMPFSALYDSFDYWPFGPDFCDVWRSFDVLASTASILNLCVISLDRYWAITDPFTYPSRMSPRRACMFIGVVWVCSALISFPAIAWWRAVSSEPHPDGTCPFTEDLSYLVFSSTISFYGPLFVMVFTYFRIYRAATEQTKSLKLGQKMVSTVGDGEMELTLRIHRGGCGGSGGGASSNGNGMPRAHYPAGKHCTYTQENGGLGNHPHSLSSPLDDGESCPLGSMHDDASPDSSTKVVARNIQKFSISRKLCKFAKEKKAAKTLGIVMGVFIVCWLPFFVTNLLSGLCGERCIREPALVGGVVTWLGWINSAMNPVIYACWAKDFRRAFTRILCSCCPRRCRNRYQTRWKGGIAQDYLH